MSDDGQTTDKKPQGKDKESEDKKDNQDMSLVERKTGVEPGQLLKAPIEPPEIKDKRPPTSKQKFYFLLGVAVLLIGIVLFPLNAYLSVVIALIGLVGAAGSILVRIE